MDWQNSAWKHKVLPILVLIRNMIDEDVIAHNIVDALEQAYNEGRRSGGESERRFPRSKDKTGS